ncbi:MAG: Maf family protein [Acidobacteriota bacterium]|nr:Maf family protein [Acidobacteriota bacterium]
MKLPKLILASGSPRRAEILNFVGWEFEKRVADIDETEFLNENPADYVQRLAREKAEAVAAHYENGLILGADTIVVIDEKIIGKPKDVLDARRMLKLLSGRWHKVLTGVALIKKVSGFKFQVPSQEQTSTNNEQQSIIGLQTTRVKFAELSDAEIEFLVEKGEPLDKAGAYAVQAQAALFIEEIQGDYWNVVGLPINLVFRLVKFFE